MLLSYRMFDPVYFLFSFVFFCLHFSEFLELVHVSSAMRTELALDRTRLACVRFYSLSARSARRLASSLLGLR